MRGSRGRVWKEKKWKSKERNQRIRKKWQGGEDVGGREVKKRKVCTALQWRQQASENRFNSGSLVHLCPSPLVWVNPMFQESGIVLLKSQSRIRYLENVSFQRSGEPLSLTEDSAPRNLWMFKLHNSDKDPSPGPKGGPMSSQVSPSRTKRKPSELWECVCVLVSLLVGLGIVSKLVRLVRSGLIGCSLFSLLVFWLVLF